MTPIYLDHNSTTPLLPEVADAMHEANRAGYLNPASQHQLGQRARRVLEETRERILALLGGKTSGMDADQFLFTSGGTEANNLAIRGLIGQNPTRLVVSAIEHPSVLAPAEYLQTQGIVVERIPVKQHGLIDLDQLEAQLLGRDDRPALVSVMLANNETGAIQPLSEVRELCQRGNILLHTDAAQAITKLDVSFRALGVDAMTIAPHKFHGPLGIGALVLRAGVKLQPQLFGGFQQEALRPGTESVTLAIGFLRALELAQQDYDRIARLTRLRDQLRDLLLSALDDIIVNGQSAPRLPNTLNVAFLGLPRQELLLALDRAGVCCSTGSACASGSSEPSPVLLAMGLASERIESSLRFSLGATTTTADITQAAERIIATVNNLRSRQKQRKSPLSPRVDS